MLFPGQTLPMTVFDAQTIDMIRTCIENDRTLGVVCLGYDKMVPIGTTAEIYECMYDPDQGFRLKAKGRQRFKILRVIIQVSFKINHHICNIVIVKVIIYVNEIIYYICKFPLFFYTFMTLITRAFACKIRYF